ncbi:MAG: S41 family peptidase [bacterium]|nr:S41 family peptidase [bacterium]
MRRTRGLLNMVTAIALALLGSFGAGYYVATQNTVDPMSQVEGLENLTEGMPEDVDFMAFWNAWNIINEKYVPTVGTSTKIVSGDDKVWGAIDGLARSLEDPYTIFFPPEDLKIFESDISGNFEGVGMEVALRDGRVTVIAPLPKTPAMKAGVKPGDSIIEIDGESTIGLSVEQAVRRIRGPRGTTVALKVARDGEEGLVDISITRAVIDIPTINTSSLRKTTKTTIRSTEEKNPDGSVKTITEVVDTVEKVDDPSLRDDGVYVIALYNFGATASDLFRDALMGFKESGSDRLIIDLRGNPGGFLDSAVQISSYFLPQGALVVKEIVGADKVDRDHRSLGYDLLTEIPRIVLLVDQGSASASEIVAGALQQHGVATLVGEQTFGKGSVQELVPVTHDTSLKITIARWLTPNGTSLSEGGLTPDVEVKLDVEAFLQGRDTQLEKAVEILNENA